MKLSPLFENIRSSQLKQIEHYLDKVWSKLGIDITFTRHFMDRVNDERAANNPITSEEIRRLFLETYKKYGKMFAKLGQDKSIDVQAVLTDISTELNIPFVLQWRRGELDLVSKTIMRKHDFKTSNKKYFV